MYCLAPFGAAGSRQTTAAGTLKSCERRSELCLRQPQMVPKLPTGSPPPTSHRKIACVGAEEEGRTPLNSCRPSKTACTDERPTSFVPVEEHVGIAKKAFRAPSRALGGRRPGCGTRLGGSLLLERDRRSWE